MLSRKDDMSQRRDETVARKVLYDTGILKSIGQNSFLDGGKHQSDIGRVGSLGDTVIAKLGRWLNEVKARKEKTY